MGSPTTPGACARSPRPSGDAVVMPGDAAPGTTQEEIARPATDGAERGEIADGTGAISFGVVVAFARDRATQWAWHAA